MTDLSEALPRVTPSATPTETEIRTWQALPRDEQLQGLQTLLGSPACAEASSATMSDILSRARATAAARRG